jgi:general secretion pathway protein N
MKRVLLISFLAILAFAAILLVRLPASWIVGFLPPGVGCGEIAGTAWNGTCSRVAFNGAPLGNLAWELHPSALLRLKVAAYVDFTRGDDFIRGDIEVGGGETYVASDLQAQMPLDPPLVPQMSSGYSGAVSVNLAHLRVEKNVIAEIEGQIETTSLVSLRERMAIGSYSVSFPKAPPGQEPVGQLMSLDGPVDFQGTLKLTREPGWVISGKVRTKPETPPGLARQFEFLAADAEGWRQLDSEGTF